MRSVWKVLFVPATAGAIVGACGHTPAGSHCPCTIGDGGLAITIGCGESACATVNGTQTGYRCDVDGEHVDPTACEGEGGAEGGAIPEAATNDAPLGQDGPKPYDASLLPDGAGPAGKCAAGADAGSCAGPTSCSCQFASSCTFACGEGAADAGFSLQCGTNHSCDLSCATTCAIECAGSAGCNFVAGAGSQVDCSGAAGCEGTVGSGGSVNCSAAQSCMVTCDGACNVNC
ncbi:MAG TPA: hypothetical protein VIY73_14355, partial [Polyangiaceae bacterium]